jgi:hypothetical protein
MPPRCYTAWIRSISLNRSTRWTRFATDPREENGTVDGDLYVDTEHHGLIDIKVTTRNFGSVIYAGYP